MFRNSYHVWEFSSFFKKIFGGHKSLLWGHWYPYFGLLVTSPLGFKARVGSALFELSGGIRVTLHIPWDSPLVRHLPTSWRPAWQLSCLFHIPARHWWDSKLGAIMSPLMVWDQADTTDWAIPARLHVWKFFLDRSPLRKEPVYSRIIVSSVQQIHYWIKWVLTPPT